MVNTTTCLALRELFIIHTRLDVCLQYDMCSAMNSQSDDSGVFGAIAEEGTSFSPMVLMHSAPSEATHPSDFQMTAG